MMASISSAPNGRRVIQFAGGDGKRRTIRLGKIPMKAAEIRKRLQFAKTVFRSAVRHGLIEEKPFADVSIKAGMADRCRFIGREQIAKILAVCSPDWRTIVALARFGGLHCPSEVTVRSPKTEHHPGKATRLIPLFPELKSILEEAFELAEEGAEFVVGGKYRESCQGPGGWRNVNLRTQFERILDKAGLDPWPRIFHNLRSSRQTELAEEFPGHVVCAWLGNSEDIAREHYLQVTDEHFSRASLESGIVDALQNPVQQVPAMACDDPHIKSEPLAIASDCEGLRKYANGQTDGVGFEEPAKSQGKSGVLPTGAAKSGAIETRNQPRAAAIEPILTDPDLARIVAAWPRLSEYAKVAIRAVIASASR